MLSVHTTVRHDFYFLNENVTSKWISPKRKLSNYSRPIKTRVREKNIQFAKKTKNIEKYEELEYKNALRPNWQCSMQAINF